MSQVHTLIISISFIGLTIVFLGIFVKTVNRGSVYETAPHTWQVQSIDTMKLSRDLAREKAADEQYIATIDTQVKLISQLGATHVAIGTPYDAEFVPYMYKWVQAARKYNLSVWFRGNLSGWEGWFDYPSITLEERKALLSNFVLNNSYLFENGDIFTSCTECENGKAGDPRFTGRTEEYRAFLIDEYRHVKLLFEEINVNVSANYYSMNGDVARLIMDKETTTALDGLVVVDHYVGSPEKLHEDITEFGVRSGGRVVLGEFGAPIPDIHGQMNQEEQSIWIEKALKLLSSNEYLAGINYWTLTDSSTSLVERENNTTKKSYSSLQSYFIPHNYIFTVKSDNNKNIPEFILEWDETELVVPASSVSVYIPTHVKTITISASGFKPVTYSLQRLPSTVYLTKIEPDFFYSLRKFFFKLQSF